MTEDIVTEILHAVAETEGVDPTDLDLVLYDHINIEAVVELVNTEKGHWKLTFEIPDHTVTVLSDGTVWVDPQHRNPQINPIQ